MSENLASSVFQPAIMSCKNEPVLMLISKELAILRKSGIVQTQKPNGLTNEL